MSFARAGSSPVPGTFIYVHKTYKGNLEEIVKISTNINEVLEHLGLPKTGGNNSYIKKRIMYFGISIEHFKKEIYTKKKNSESILILETHLSKRKPGYRLTKELLATGRDYKCENCSLGKIWKSKILRLEVDHKNGQWWDNRENNLRFLCPNCHAQLTNGKIWEKNKQLSAESFFDVHLLQSLLYSSNNWLDLLSNLNINNPLPFHKKEILEYCLKQNINLDTFKIKKKSKGDYTKEDFKKAIRNSFSVYEFAEELDLPKTTAHRYFKKQIKIWENDFSHFVGQGHLKGGTPSNKKKSEDILIKSNSVIRAKSKSLRFALLDIGRSLECEGCSLGEEYNKKYLKLQIHHKDEDWSNNQKRKFTISMS